MSLLEIKNLNLSFDDQSVVKGINLKIDKGEVHGLIGESGSGKSLTALSIMKLLPESCRVDSGEILLQTSEGVVNLLQLQDKQLQKLRGDEIGFIFQDPMTSMNPVIKCGRQVIEVIALHTDLNRKQQKERVLELFEKVRLPDPEKAFNAYPHEISGGQRQRVMIAQAIACKPRLLIADEPTTALDVSVQMSIIELIDELRKSEELGVLFITHDLGLISHYADKLSIMYRGDLIEYGPTKDIIQNPRENYTKGLLACKPPLDKRLKRLPVLKDFESGGISDSIKEDVFISDEVLMHVKDLSVFYPLETNFLGKPKREMQALQRVSFDLFKGESLGLIGESGSGKSTLGRTLLQLIEARTGQIEYEGKDLVALDNKSVRQLRKKIQFIFQDPYSSLNPKHQIGNQLVEASAVFGLHGDDAGRQKRAEEMLDMVGLAQSDFNKYPHEFSGGQRQRIVIARALMLEPEFIICDEAVSALDVSVQAQILNLMKELKEQFQLTYLFITHDMSVVRFFCDRMLVMKSGQILDRGRVDGLFDRPGNEYTKELIKAAF